MELGPDVSIDLSDPFGGLIPLDDVDEQASGMPTFAPPAAPDGRGDRACRALCCAASLAHRAPQHPLHPKAAGDLSKLPIDHRAGFLLAHVDGMQTLEEILDVCAMPATEALELIDKLQKMGVIEFE